MRSDDHLGEDLRDGLRQVVTERPVDHDDAAVRRLPVGGVSLVPRSEQRVRAGDPAGIGVLEDGDRGPLEFSDQVGGGGDVENVVITEFLP